MIGPQAITQYYKHYKLIDRIKEENLLNNIPDSIYTAIHSATTKHAILPSKLGLLKY